MDLLTHTFVSISTAQFASSFEKNKTGSHKIYYIVGLLSGLFPDIDAFLGLFTKTRLDYLLLRRTYTHSVLALGLEFLIIALVVFLLTKRKKINYFSLFLLSFFNLFFHTFLDFLNNYGVLFLWPFNNKWFYGDTLFIIEPYIILALFINLSINSEKRIIKAAYYAGLITLLGVYGFSQYSDFYSTICLVIFGLAYWFITKKFSFLVRISLLFVTIGITISTFYFLSKEAKTSILKSANFVDIVLTPTPANPFHWSVIGIEVDKRNDTYRIHKGYFYFLYQGRILNKINTCKLENPTLKNEDNITWLGSFEISFKKFNELTTNCTFNSYLNWSRAPFIEMKNEYSLVGDLRFDMTRGNDFAEIQFDNTNQKCSLDLIKWKTPLVSKLADLVL